MSFVDMFKSFIYADKVMFVNNVNKDFTNLNIS